jgi:hypothetical protein
MKPIKFPCPIDNQAIFDFIPFFAKQDFNDSVLSTQILLKEHGIRCKTSSLKEYMAHAIGYNSVAHLLSDLPFAFRGMDAIYNLNVILNHKTQYAIVFEALHHQHFKITGEHKFHNYHDYVERFAKEKVVGTSYCVMSVDYDLGAFFDSWGDTHEDQWDYYWRASALVQFFPVYMKLDLLISPCEDTMDTIWHAADSSGSNSSDKAMRVDDVFEHMEYESIIWGYVEEMDINLLRFISSYIQKMACEKNVDVAESSALRLMMSEKAGFSDWLSKQVGRDDAISDLASDAKRDPEFKSNSVSYKSVVCYLKNKNVSSLVIDAARESWMEFSHN